MQRSFFVLVIVSLFLSLTQCASSTVGVASSNKPIPNTPYETIKSVDKTFNWYSVDLIIISGSMSTPPTDKIYEAMMEGEAADAIVNIRYYNEKAVYGPILKHTFGIKGDLIKYTTAQSLPSQTKGKK
jgi:hypothetical protein